MIFPPTIFRDQRFAVVGLGRNGLPAAHALVAMGATVTVWDDNAAACARAAAEGLTVAEPDMHGLTALVLSPGIPHTFPKPHPIAAAARAAGVKILSDADLLYRAVRAAGSQARFVGITGTNGKSTTTALLAHIVACAGLPVAAGGNLGTAALALPLLPDNGVYVLEMSSYMLERLERLHFTCAVLLNLSPDHLDRHGDMAGYTAAKRHIFDRQEKDDLAVIGCDDPRSTSVFHALRNEDRMRVLGVSGDTPIPALRAARALPGNHNTQNAAAATAVAHALGISDAVIAPALLSYPGLPHRQELVGEINGIAFINDSKATNADSTATALVCYDRIIWIAGGMAKEGGIASLAQYFPRIALALLIGRDAPALAMTLAEHAVPHRISETLEAATEQAWTAAHDGLAPVVLLSPACASWDQFSGFDQRGDRFRTLVQAIAQRSAE